MPGSRGRQAGKARLTMLPLFANPAGLWALLGLPAILAIHFLQQRARIARTSTWFLLEKLAPDSARGRTWDRLRSSRTLWMQLLAVLVATWLLAAPRWVRDESAQTVVIVLDASAAMDAFRPEGIAAAEREMSLADGLATHTTWVVLTTNPRQPPLYRGPDRVAAAAVLGQWQPDLGEHDLGPALRLGHSLAGATGRTLLVTEQRAKVPAGQRAVGVGRPVENVGFAGASFRHDEAGGLTWRALVKNHASTPQHRTWQLEVGAMKSPEQSLDLAPDALTEISAQWPEGVDAVTVVLSPDAFAADDRLPLVRPQPKPLAVQVDGDDEAARFFKKLVVGVDGVTLVPASPTLRLARLNAEEAARETHGGIFWAPADERAQAPLMTEPVTPERDPLVAGLNWQGWFGTGPHGYAVTPADTALLWQSRWPIAFLRAAPAGGRKLMLAFDWATSNAARLPSTVLLARRFLEAERDAQRAPYAANFDANAPIPLAGVPADGALTLAWQPAAGGIQESHTILAAERGELRAPGRAGFFSIKRGDELVVRGGVQFADARQGDFKSAETFFIELPGERRVAMERSTRPDPLANVWRLVLVALVLASWWVRTGSNAGAPTHRDAVGPVVLESVPDGKTVRPSA